MTLRCPRRGALITALLGNDKPRADLMAHADRCETCAAVRRTIVRLDSTYDDEDAPSEAIDRDIAAIVVATLGEMPPYRWPTVAADFRHMQHASVVRHLLKLSDEAYMSDPRRSCEYAAAAASIAEKMYRRGEAPPDLAIDAMKEHATCLRALGRFGYALSVLATAEPIAAASGEPAHAGVLMLSRAMIYADSEVCQFDDALALASECEAIFRGVDVRRAALAAFVQAGVHFRTGQTSKALLAYQRIHADLAAHGSPFDVALADQGIGLCFIELGQLPEARRVLTAARRVFEQLGSAVEVARTDWDLARADMRAGEHDAAIATLLSVARSFADARIFDQWVLVKLDLVQALRERDPEADVAEICESIAAMSVSIDERESSRKRRCTAEALEYLRRNAESHALTAGIVSYVRHYVARVNNGVVTAFVPPVDHVM